MQSLKIYTVKPKYLKTNNLYPRNYDPIHLFAKEKLKSHPCIMDVLIDDIKGGSTPPYYLFRDEFDKAIPFVKTSAISSDFINLNDLHYIHPDFHNIKIKRSITKPFDVIYSMTGKFMGKAALSPPTIPEINMSQNSVVLKTKSPIHSALLTIFLNSLINKDQISGMYSITKQKYLNQGKIAKLRIIKYESEYDKDLTEYLEGIESYYNAIEGIKKIICQFNENFKIVHTSFFEKYSFSIQAKNITEKALTSHYYRKDFDNELAKFEEDESIKKLRFHDLRKGDEIGSNNYDYEGIPFIRTSNILNFGVDYQSNYYCSPSIYGEFDQDLRVGDILYAKDGKIGETAIVEESAKIVISSGIVRIRLIDEGLKYWLFLLLSSNYGKMFFYKWTVIASTMAHLRKDFVKDFKFPKFDTSYKSELIKEIQQAFESKKKAVEKIRSSKQLTLERLCKKLDIL